MANPAPTDQNSLATRPAAKGQQQFTQADLNRIVMEYLNKKGFHKTEAMFRLESSNTATPLAGMPNPASTSYPGPTEISLGYPTGGKQTKADIELREMRDKVARTERELRDFKDKGSYDRKEEELRLLKEEEEKQKRENDPDIYARAYSILRSWVETSLDLYKPELSRILYPLLFIATWSSCPRILSSTPKYFTTVSRTTI